MVGWPPTFRCNTLQQAKDYFATHYAPNNITGVPVGDFQDRGSQAPLAKYFGLKRGPEPPEVVTEPKSLGEKRFTRRPETSPTVRVWWQGVPIVHKDSAVPRSMTDILSGRTGRLTKRWCSTRRSRTTRRAFVNGHGGIVGPRSR